MEYKGYNITEEDGRIIVDNVREFDPVHVFECGQCFRWLKQPDKSYTGIAFGRVANVSFKDGRLTILNANARDFIDIWYDYFDLGTDYEEIKQLLKKDEIMEKAIAFGQGIRFLKQDIWEMVISFIISANNRIPMIMKTVAAISKVYGEKIAFDDNSYYAFPGVDRLAGSGIEQLEACKGGFRCKYILKTSEMLRNKEVDLSSLAVMETGEARKELMKLPGVGPKVADCILLFSGTKYDVFPTDVWVKRVMEELYFKREASFKEIQDFAAGYFGKLTGFAQQYLFYYARENKIGVSQS